MRKIISFILAAFLTAGMWPAAALAAKEPSFHFELTVEGGETRQVHTGDVITVVLRLKRRDATDPYTMYAMQDEIRYDGHFFRLVEGSEVPGKDIVVEDIGMRDQYREFYMNYLSASGGATWEADTLVGSFQLEVIADSGVTKITSQDYLVSSQDGSDSLDSTANELTVILTTECRVCFESKGGSRIEDQMVQYGEKISKPGDPTREGYLFEGWYKDLDGRERWDFEKDTATGNLTLYAGWTREDEGITSLPSSGPGLTLLLPVGGALLLGILLIGRRIKKLLTGNRFCLYTF